MNDGHDGRGRRRQAGRHRHRQGRAQGRVGARHFVRGILRGAMAGAVLSLAVLAGVAVLVQWPGAETVRAASAD